LWRKKQTLHASTTTPHLRLHGSHAPRVEKKAVTHTVTDAKKTMQTQKANVPNCSLVEFLKRFHSHKERKQKIQLKQLY